MAWGPGQQTPVHDHSGIWCVEGVFEGVVDVTRYDLQELIGTNVARMRRTEVIHAGRGECGALIPPVEYHSISNPYDRPAYTVHVYGGRMRTCRVFRESGDDTYEIAVKDLAFTSSQAAL
jgi:predicted metal-dependent enzyme (double-stranded beta helix superfamily)